jgi:acetyl-CoA/propionyl-CoA carboxylase biotin carboxyl carrier protein
MEFPETEGPGALDLLDPEAMVVAARAANADAIHPGFGFLAESPDLAERTTAAGLRWVGPPPDAIRLMGDKGAARRLARSLGVPVPAGYEGADQSIDALRAAAAEIGLPLLVKPAAGGGGKGMHVVRDPAQLDAAVGAARREAGAAFADDRLILEHLVEGARHIEIQVLFDTFGRGVQLGERDCSIQRRHQKVLEETPSPAVREELRATLGSAALALAGAVGYVGAGTCEFLVDERGAFTFLEMNTRLQVEHPVTEAVTGRDLVADQLRIAAGQPLDIVGDAVRSHGHAIEVRLYAEDADAGFLPATGRVEALHWPTGDGIRVDAGIGPGTDVTGRFDPMLAKVIAWAPDRAGALDRLGAALDETVVLGLVTNLRFLRWLVRQAVVRDGQARTDTLERIWPPDDWAAATAIPEVAWQTAARALADSNGDRRSGPAGDPWTGGWRINAPRTVRLDAEGDQRTVELGEAAAEGGTGPRAVRVGGLVHVDVSGRSIAFGLAAPPDVDRAARAAIGHGAGDTGPAEISAPMPGAIVAIRATDGDEVAVGDPIVTLEAMKMEHVVAAPIAGRLRQLTVVIGDQVTRGQVIAVVEP